MIPKERMLSGRLYHMTADEELTKDYIRCKRLLTAFNHMTEYDTEKQDAIIRELFGKIGKGFHVEPPFRCDYGKQILAGDHLYINCDCIIIDVCPVTIGNHVLIGPRVGIYTAAHPVDASVRNTGLEYGRPITIGDNVWIGGGATLNPGVTIGENSIIGSGSIVTKDIPPNVIAAGNPCRVLRPVTEEDAIYWKGKELDYLQDKDAPPIP
ncbi:sugar O-acetyltransferase [Lacrimispora sp. NSJ-141]|uniref:Acetyltransferase n=1 Tax=Lientehia hominis TaxID=2897778 RepID=A0AAP2RKU6_9FIRM|nr:sugar O-acetyltransferase [Lientehia hominis]MCD2493444.1 sugar O-acetyltransferase [Lientehia hominis]